MDSASRRASTGPVQQESGSRQPARTLTGATIDDLALDDSLARRLSFQFNLKADVLAGYQKKLREDAQAGATVVQRHQS